MPDRCDGATERSAVATGLDELLEALPPKVRAGAHVAQVPLFLLFPHFLDERFLLVVLPCIRPCCWRPCPPRCAMAPMRAFSTFPIAVR